MKGPEKMIQKIKSLFLVMTAMTAVVLPAALPTAVTFAACSNIGNKLGAGASGAATGTADEGFCTSPSGTGTSDVASLASKIVNIFSIIVGAIAVIMIIYGGFRYITSGGDSGRVGNAKSTLLYAVVGLIIVALAQLIVHFVINFSSTSVTAQ